MSCRGLALLETLIALLVISAGMLTLGRAQTRLWLAIDLAREQGQALAFSQADLERLREQSASSLTAHDALASMADSEQPAGPTLFILSRRIERNADAPYTAVTSRVRWQDRHGRDHQGSLHTMLARLDRRLSGWLALAPGIPQVTTPRGRDANIPPEARLLSDGRIAFKPRTDQTDTWIFDTSSARIIATCVAPAGRRNEQLQASDLSACTAVNGRLLSGWIGYTTTERTPTVADAERPSGPVLAADLRLTPSGTAPAWRCLTGATDEPHPDGALPYWCLIQPRSSPLAWSGRLDLVPIGWTLTGTPEADAQARRVCRYSADHDGNGRIDNAEHPAQYTDVQGPLTQQNFLVIPGAAACPVDGAVHLDADSSFNGIDDTTVAHQP